ncbi:MAG: PAS domain-containing protein [Chloroflexi bacterium]|nr:PAS domain-containing protein [Chloroflexota bacterium]
MADLGEESDELTGSDSEPVMQLVVLGASAGGVDALTALVSSLPVDFGAPIVVAQHLAPSRTSHLGEILGQRAQLPVRTVVDRERLERGVVYVVPSDRHVEITDHEVRVVSDTDRGRPMPSVDRLLETAARSFGENLIAVILTGTGSDGADGARHVKDAGGTVVIQNPQTASHPEMPLSLAPTTVDIVADLPAIGALLQDLLAGTYARGQPDDDRRLRGLLDDLRLRSGVDFSGYKEQTIRRRLQRRMLDTSVRTLEDYVRYTRRHPEEFQRLSSSFLIKVTDFFRDPETFDYLREHVLPGVIASARERGNELRLWSAGCATGEEPYSLALLVADMLGDNVDGLNIRIFATDLDAEAIAFARRGVYPSSALGHLPPHLLDRYFTRLDGAYEVKKFVRGLVVFGQHDLGQRAPFPRIDVALCRNVLIYFTPELQRRALQLFAFALRDAGYLVLGKAESSTPLAEYFTLVQPRLQIYRRHGERVVLAPTRIRDVTPTAPMAKPATRPALLGIERELARVHVLWGAKAPSERAEQVLLELPIGVVVVDRRYDVQSINPAARRLLGIHASAIGEDLIHQALRGLAEPLRDVVDAALQGNTRHVVYELDTMPDTPGEPRWFELQACPYRPMDHADNEELVLITVADVTERESLRRAREAAAAQAEHEVRQVRALLDESTASVRQLIEANEELAATNATLRSANEELLVGNEESQAGMEEIETLNEEQQATNEELETLNEELQATVEELNTTNDDLQARGLELQQMARSVDEERSRLAAVLTSLPDGVLVMDRRGVPILTNQAYQRLFGDGPVEAVDEQGRRLPDELSPQLRAAHGEQFRLQFRARVAHGYRRFEASGQPIRADGVDGGVMVIREISDHGK